ncbi:MAG TPA: peptide deformylase [Clostridiales bacterium]|nr:peptide deformylase [Clostridiales bacterium]
MAIRNIIQVGDEILRKKSKPVKEFDQKLAELLDDMRETMVKNDGCGLAGVQVGILRRVVVLDVNHMKIELINPEIVDSYGESIEREGCLSVKGETGYVKRPSEVTVKAFDRYGNEFILTGVDMLARALCHEIDHLDGILYIDKVIKDYKEKKDKK